MIGNLLIGSTILLGGYTFYKSQMKSLEKVEYIIENHKIPKEFDDFSIACPKSRRKGIVVFYDFSFGNGGYFGMYTKF